MSWFPHVTVASVVEKDGRFLLVREKNEQGIEVFNQPAGHLEPGESLLDCAIRETMEETGWQVNPVALLSVRLYTSPTNGITYLRTNIIAEPIKQTAEQALDSDIIDTHWLSPMEIKKFSTNLRSPLVLNAIDDFLAGKNFPLDIIEASISEAY